MRKMLALVAGLLLVLAMSAGADDDGLDAARYDTNGDLLRPADLDRWVFLGASMGMGYSDAEFDPGSPGMFQVVLMEPGAYARFNETGEFADGSMFVLSFYGVGKRLSINRAGFVQDELMNFEIHVKDGRRFGEGRAFYLFGAGDEKASVVPPGSACVTCHEANGALDGVFVQFYPAIRDKIPADALKRALANDGESGE